MVVVGTLLRALRTLRPPAPAGASGRLSVLQTVLSPVWRRTCPVRTVHVSSAGHSKWIKVKQIKGPQDEARAKMFMKLRSQIRTAVREGGPNPNLNTALANLLQICRDRNIPKSSTDAVLKTLERAKLTSELKIDIRGPGGCLLLVEVLSGNHNNITSAIKRLLIRNGGKMFDKNQKNFNQKGVVLVSGQDVTTERALELAIEVGAEDVQNTEDDDDEEKPQLKFICAATKLSKMKASLEGLGMQILYAELEFIPNNCISLDNVQMEEASALIEALNNCEYVVRVWDNFQT